MFEKEECVSGSESEGEFSRVSSYGSIVVQEVSCC